jgi:formylglycine-generating enzyme
MHRIAVLLVFSFGCRSRPTTGTSPSASAEPAAARVESDAAAPRPGMAWIPPGTLKAGTPVDRTPRVADEELAGTEIPMQGFYIDLLPWPNEPNAIPTSNVSRDEAEQLCSSKGKRLCTELEWERACKGPDNVTYEYGDTYRKEVCGTGDAVEHAARRPTGEHAQCKSAFGVAEMHGSVFEWTSSTWGRSSRDATQGVLRGGNSVAGELVARCANAIARAPSKKSPTMGLRCCAGPKNDAEVKLELLGTLGLGAGTRAQVDPLVEAIAAVATKPVEPTTLRSFRWVPVANEELTIGSACSAGIRACALVVGRGTQVLASVGTGAGPAEVARVGDARHLRIRYLEPRGMVGRDVTYSLGRVEIGEPKYR